MVWKLANVVDEYDSLIEKSKRLVDLELCRFIAVYPLDHAEVTWYIGVPEEDPEEMD